MRPHASMYGFTDASFHAVLVGGEVDGKMAAALVPWAKAVARGDVRLPEAHEGVRRLAREICVLNAARVSATP